ncbi:hypothetical protein [Pseudonocardia spinosispora]|uniref:hypothetical protein n=1 Tax=Pseudonocardia spinosispora TaxID=103441 RepID=UPI0004186065|nr:hypothetical protein [Pseudonocardia spinosispora]
MIPALSVFVLLYSAMLGLWALGSAVRRVRPGPANLGGMILLELMLLLRAILDGSALLAGRSVAEPSVHVAYLIASVALLPLILGVTRAPSSPGERSWDGAVAVVCCAAVAVVTLRMTVTGRPV